MAPAADVEQVQYPQGQPVDVQAPRRRPTLAELAGQLTNWGPSNKSGSR
jgi:hypothetical protein